MVHYQPNVVGMVLGWYERLWQDAQDFQEELLELLRPPSLASDPPTVFLCALLELYDGDLGDGVPLPELHALTAFQRDGLIRAKRILDRYGGVLYAGGVGVGKIEIGVQLIREHTQDLGQHVLVISPAQLRDRLWEQPLVSEGVFEQVQRMLTARRPAVRHPRAVSSHYLLSGLAHCGHCGSAALGTNGKSGKFLYYSCNAPSINAKTLEGFVIDRIKENILTEENLRDLVEITNEELRGNRRQARGELAALERSIDAVSLKLTRLYAALESGKVDIDDLAPRLKELRAPQRTLGERRDQAPAETNQPACAELDLPKVRQYAGEIRSLLESSTFLESKTFLASFVRKVEYTKKDVAIEYTTPVLAGTGLNGDREVLNTNRDGCPAWVRTRDFSSKG